MKRRMFLKAVGGVAGVTALGVPEMFAAGTKAQELPRRMLGRTGKKVSIVAFPGLALTKCD